MRKGQWDTSELVVDCDLVLAVDRCQPGCEVLK
jgi:hypothetical protein